MEQSIAAAPIRAGENETTDKSWKSVLAGFWPALITARAKVIAGRQIFSKPLDADISSNLAIDRIAARLGIENRACEDGANERPPSSEEDLSGTEREIFFYFRQLHQAAQRQVAKAYEKLNKLGNAIDLSKTVGSIRDIHPRCEHEIRRLTVDFESRLDFAHQRERQQQKQYDEFRKRNGLDRIAEYPKYTLTVYLAITAIVSAVTLAIMSIPASGAESGTVLPMSKTFAIALLATLVPFVLAAGLIRFINHKQALARAAAWLTSAATVAYIAALALYTAQLITGSTLTAEITIQGVIDSILSGPAAIGANIGAWKGLGIVAAGGVLALLVGYKSNDSYPGYGRVQKAYYRARLERELLAGQLRRRINAIVDSAQRELKVLSSRLRKQIPKFSLQADACQEMPLRIRDFEAALEDACNILLDRYRVANENSRSTPVPLSFSQLVCFANESEAITARPKDLQAQVEAMKRGLSDSEREAIEIRQNLRELNQRAIDGLETRFGNASE
jgi:DNA-directed RNA polymerase subunit F